MSSPKWSSANPDDLRLHQYGTDLIRRDLGRRKERVLAGRGIEIPERADASHSLAVVVVVSKPNLCVHYLVRPDDFLTFVIFGLKRIQTKVFGSQPDVLSCGTLREWIELGSTRSNSFDNAVRTHSKVVFAVFDTKPSDSSNGSRL